jgi:hypothetical protein
MKEEQEGKYKCAHRVRFRMGKEKGTPTLQIIQGARREKKGKGEESKELRCEEGNGCKRVGIGKEASASVEGVRGEKESEKSASLQ